MDHDPTLAHVVLIAHGSRADEANDTHRQVCARLAERLGRPVHPAFLELADPSIGDAIGAAAAAGAQQIDVLPHFLYPGRHVRRDIPAQVSEAAASSRASVVLLDPTGNDDRVLALLASQLEADAERRTMF